MELPHLPWQQLTSKSFNALFLTDQPHPTPVSLPNVQLTFNDVMCVDQHSTSDQRAKIEQAHYIVLPRPVVAENQHIAHWPLLSPFYYNATVRWHWFSSTVTISDFCTLWDVATADAKDRLVICTTPTNQHQQVWHYTTIP